MILLLLAVTVGVTVHLFMLKTYRPEENAEVSPGAEQVVGLHFDI